MWGVSCPSATSSFLRPCGVPSCIHGSSHRLPRLGAYQSAVRLAPSHTNMSWRPPEKPTSRKKCAWGYTTAPPPTPVFAPPGSSDSATSTGPAVSQPASAVPRPQRGDHRTLTHQHAAQRTRQYSSARIPTLPHRHRSAPTSSAPCRTLPYSQAIRPAPTATSMPTFAFEQCHLLVTSATSVTVA